MSDSFHNPATEIILKLCKINEEQSIEPYIIKKKKVKNLKARIQTFKGNPRQSIAEAEISSLQATIQLTLHRNKEI